MSVCITRPTTNCINAAIRLLLLGLLCFGCKDDKSDSVEQSDAGVDASTDLKGTDTTGVTGTESGAGTVSDTETDTLTDHGTAGASDGGASETGLGTDSDGNVDAGTDQGTDGTDVDTEAPVGDYQCVRDLEQLAIESPCSLDVQCPCGAHCDRGKCRNECLSDADCDGWCDAFGRCRSVDDYAAVPGLLAPTQTDLKISPLHLKVYEWSESVAFRVRTSGQPLADVRLTASDGLLVKCDDNFVSECLIPTIPVDEPLPVDVKLDGELGDFEGGTVNVYHENIMRTVSISAGSSQLFSNARPGRYLGNIWLNDISIRLNGNEPFEDVRGATRFTALQLPVEISLYSDGTISFVDTFGILPSNWAFAVDEEGYFDAVEDDVDLSRQVYLGGAETMDDVNASEVSVSGSGNLRAVGNTLSGAFTMKLDGLGLAVIPSMVVDERPTIGWQFNGVWAEEIPETEIAPVMGGGEIPVFDSVFDRHTNPLPWETAVAACGDVSAADDTHDVRIAKHLCYEHPGTFDSVPLSNDVNDLTLLGDLKCASEGLNRTAFPFFTNGDLSEGGLMVRTVLDNCINELEDLHSRSPATSLTEAGCMDDLSGCGTDGCDASEIPACVDGPMAMRTLGLAMESIGQDGWPDMLYWPVASEQGARLAHRLLQQWVQVHGFVAQEATQSTAFLLGGDSAHLEEALATSLKGWDILLHPKVTARLFHIPPEILAAPDYRIGVADPGAFGSDSTQHIGLSVVILEGLRAQLDGMERLVNRSRFEGTAIPSQVASVLKYSAVLIPMAELLHALAESGGAIAWEGEWEDVKRRFELALDKLLKEIRAHEAQVNPLGISDEDLPLYRDATNPEDAGERFSAVARYLLDGWATEAVNAALASHSEAVSAWTGLLDRQIQLDTADVGADRVDEIRHLYGEKILNMCGNPFSLEDAALVLDESSWPGLSANNCFTNPANQACRFNDTELMERLTVDDVTYQLCVVAEMRMSLGDRAVLSDDFFNSKVDALQAEINQMYDASQGSFWERMDFANVYTYGRDCYEAIREATGGSQGELSKMLDFTDLELSGSADHQAILDAESTCAAQVPGGAPFNEVMESLPSSPLDMPDCYQGSIGELALAARAASKDVDIAVSELQDHIDAYKNGVNRCVIDEQGLKGIATVSEQLGNLTNRLGEYQNLVNHAAQIPNAVANTFSGSFSKDGVGLDVSLGPLTEMVTGWITEASSGMLGIDELTAWHANFVAEYQQEIARAQCFNDAEIHLVAVDTQAKRIERSKLDLSHAILALNNAKSELSRLITEGRARVAREQTRSRSSLFHDIWNDLWAIGQDQYRGAIEAYRRDMRLAQRTVYLAIRAVEYEWQVTHTARQDVIAATDPQSLASALSALKEEIATGAIAGQRPENLHVVLSLKDQLFQLVDREGWPAGSHTMSASEQLRAVLSSPQFARFDAEGEYEGQLIPISIAPLGIMGLGEAGSIPLLAGSDCAERIWSVNAVLSGTGLVDNDTTFTRVELLHKNTFYSQWCEAPAEGAEEIQLSSVRPSRNLFKDPVWGSDYGLSVTDNSEFMRARIQAYHNITRQQLEEEGYTQGSSEELAARALYGQYALFFPAEFLDVDRSGGLHLNRIDDIYLRVDYVSAAKRW